MQAEAAEFQKLLSQQNAKGSASWLSRENGFFPMKG